MLAEGVYHRTATHPEWEGPVSAYAIDDGELLILIDPIAVPDDVRALFGRRARDPRELAAGGSYGRASREWAEAAARQACREFVLPTHGEPAEEALA
jgi:hypothetical protein